MAIILVTGATGFLGSAVCKTLLQQKHIVYGIGRDDKALHALNETGVVSIKHDISQPFSNSHVETLKSVDAIVHCAALSTAFAPKNRFIEANIVGTSNLIKLAQKIKVTRFVNISSPTIYFNFKDQLNIKEDHQLPSPVNDYAYTKRVAEKMVLKDTNISPINLRPRGIYGAGDKTLLPSLLSIVKKRPLPLFRNGVAQIDLTHVEDVVSAIICALNAPENAANQSYNISSGEVLPVKKIIDDSCQYVGIEPRWVKIPLPFAMIYGTMVEMVGKYILPSANIKITRYTLGLLAYKQSLDISKANAMLKWKPKILFREGLIKTFLHSGRG